LFFFLIFFLLLSHYLQPHLRQHSSIFVKSRKHKLKHSNSLIKISFSIFIKVFSFTTVNSFSIPNPNQNHTQTLKSPNLPPNCIHFLYIYCRHVYIVYWTLHILVFVLPLFPSINSSSPKIICTHKSSNNNT